MCGISVLIKKSLISEQEIDCINQPIFHRGPDDSGVFIDKNVGLGHRRLSIIDLSEAGHQPMKYLDKYFIVFNGEIYNYIEIRSELKKQGYQFKNSTDTEVILAAYDYWGEACVNYFNGMWAFSIYDKQSRSIFCSRDRFGIKPLYYKSTPDFICMGSEIKQILAYDKVSLCNTKMLTDFLVYGYSEHTTETFFDGINTLLPGHNMLINASTLEYKIYQYYTLEEKSDSDCKSKIDYVEKFLGLLDSSVNLRLRSDVAIGGCLSGGLDSSSIIGVASQYNQNFNAFTAKSESIDTDESFYAKLVSEHLGVNQHWITPSESEFQDTLSQLAYIQEEPYLSPSIFMQYSVFKAVKEQGVTVLLDGQGGDETLLGYERYYPAALGSKGLLSKFLSAREISQNSKLSYLQVLKYYLYFTNQHIRKKARLRESIKYLSPQIIGEAERSDIIKKSADSYSSLFNLQFCEIGTLQLPHLLRYEDKTSMYHSIETRLPFLDYRLVEFNVNLPLEFKIQNGWTKYILRQAVNPILPKEVVWRKNKFGFQAPENKWYERIIRSAEIEQFVFNQSIVKYVLSKACLDTKDLKQFPKKMLWRLLSIAYWANEYKVSIK
ncbi:asparagine synthase (glutamine-hydrolyzing) [Francisellaceae bacterium]|nr:asparagine synthase (glutamine-hydrolyzing) [Francisellaceae bacterium]